MSSQENLSFGALSLAELAVELDVLGDHASAGEVRALVESRSTDDTQATEVARSSLVRAWKHKATAIAYIGEGGGLVSASSMEGDVALVGERINLKLDTFYVRNYPGLGEHEVAVRWGVKHQAKGLHDAENVTFTQRFRVRDRQASAQTGFPIFMGLRVPRDGIGFTLDVTYLKNKGGERFLEFLNNPAIKGGLTMIEQANPAIGAVTAMATGAIDSVLTANDGRLIHDNVYVGMDFQDAPSGVRLREGSYIVAQTPTRSLDWSSWRVESGDLVPAAEGSDEEFPYNYLVIRVEKSVQSAES